MVQQNLKIKKRPRTKTKVVIICGPTASGKTVLGTRLAQIFNGEIISADSQQVYKGLNIGTAKPDASILNDVTHHLIDVVTPDQQFDVSKFLKFSDEAVAKIVSKNKNVFVVGGTGLYIKAFCKGIVAAPPKDQEYRRSIESKKTSELYTDLLMCDPETARRVENNDRTRIVRALEVYRAVGESITKLQESHKFSDERYKTLKIGLVVEREELYNRINQRVEKMVSSGLVDETIKLIEKYGLDSPGLKAVGYKEIAQGLRQKNLETIVDKIKMNTRRYAKRQLTWFRADKEVLWFSPDQFEKIKKVVDAFLSK